MYRILIVGLFAIIASCGPMSTQAIRAQRDAEFARIRAEWVAEHAATLDPHIAQAIRDGRVVIGMTRDQAMVAWGVPYTVNRTTTEAGVTEQYVYREAVGPYAHRYRFFYIEAGRVVAVQETP